MSILNSFRSLTLAAACFVPVLAFAAAPAAEDFFRLIHDGNDEGLRRLIKDGADLNIRDSHRWPHCTMPPLSATLGPCEFCSNPAPM